MDHNRLPFAFEFIGAPPPVESPLVLEWLVGGGGAVPFADGAAVKLAPGTEGYTARMRITNPNPKLYTIANVDPSATPVAGVSDISLGTAPLTVPAADAGTPGVVEVDVNFAFPATTDGDKVSGTIGVAEAA